MKNKKSAGKIIILLVLVATIIGVNYYVNSEVAKKNELWQQKIWFRFTNDVNSTEDFIDLDVDEIKSYKTKYEGFNHKIYYSNLTDNEKVVYTAYQYAYDNNYKYIFVDDELLAKSDFDAVDIVYIFSFDNILLQQNLAFDNYDGEPNFVKKVYWKYITKTSKGTIIGVENFSAERVKKVSDSVEKLKNVDFGFSQNTSDYEKATAIFKYVQEKLVYTDIESDEKTGMGRFDFLSEAVTSGKVNCDGYAIMFGVLCELNGIKTFDKGFIPLSDTEENEIGHTWNAVFIDGEWYNADCTESKEVSKDDTLFFENTQLGFADDLSKNIPNYKKLIPELNKNLIPFSGRYTSFSEKGLINSVFDYLDNSEEKKVVFAVENYGDGDEDFIMNEIVNHLNSGISWMMHKTENYVLFFVYASE